MVFAPDTELALRFVVNLINSAANGEENLPTVEDLDEFLRQEGFSGSRAHDAARTVQHPCTADGTGNPVDSR
jgi:hypothetical protein